MRRVSPSLTLFFVPFTMSFSTTPLYGLNSLPSKECDHIWKQVLYNGNQVKIKTIMTGPNHYRKGNLGQDKHIHSEDNRKRCRKKIAICLE